MSTRIGKLFTASLLALVFAVNGFACPRGRAYRTRYVHSSYSVVRPVSYRTYTRTYYRPYYTSYSRPYYSSNYSPYGQTCNGYSYTTRRAYYAPNDTYYYSPRRVYYTESSYRVHRGHSTRNMILSTVIPAAIGAGIGGLAGGGKGAGIGALVGGGGGAAYYLIKHRHRGY